MDFQDYFKKNSENIPKIRDCFVRQVKLLLTFLLLLVVAASCKSVAYLSRGIDIHLEDAKQAPLNAELNVDLNQKVTATSDMQDTKKEAIVHAYYKCITTNNIDVVVDPIVKITRYSVFSSADMKGADNAKWWKPQFKAEINGYGGKYIKLETQAEQVKKFDNIDMNSVVKYKLINDPDFHKSYYKEKSNNVFIGANGPVSHSQTTLPAPQNQLNVLPPMPKIQPLSYSEMLRKATVTRNVGIAFTAIGVAMMIPVALPVMFCCYYDDWVGYYILEPIGAGFTAVGIGCLAAGCVKINKLKKSNLSLSYNLAPNGAQLALKF